MTFLIGVVLGIVAVGVGFRFFSTKVEEVEKDVENKLK
jgi:hypothetical protein